MKMLRLLTYLIFISVTATSFAETDELVDLLQPLTNDNNEVSRHKRQTGLTASKKNDIDRKNIECTQASNLAQMPDEPVEANLLNLLVKAAEIASRSSTTAVTVSDMFTATQCDVENDYQCPAVSSVCNCENIHTLCDGIRDCPDGSDENITFCKEQCREKHGWWCPKFKKCIHRTNMCDGGRSCGGLSEKNRYCRRVDCPEDLGYIRCGGVRQREQCVRVSDLCTAETSPCHNGWVLPEEERVWTCGPEVDCSNHVPLTVTYPGSVSTPSRLLGSYDGGVNVCLASLYAHNWVRRNHRNTGQLTYDDALAVTAEAWAMHLADNNFFEHSPSDQRNGRGENLYVGSSSSDIKKSMGDAMLGWYEEMHVAEYNFTTGSSENSGVIGHFTQAVWADTQRVGCGVARRLISSNYKTYIACHYDPPGNYVGEYQANVLTVVERAIVPSHPMEMEYMNGGCTNKWLSCRTYRNFCSTNELINFACPLECHPDC